MNTYEIIKKLATKKHMTIAELERKLNLSNGQIARWKKANPNSSHLKAIADYFDVSVDYLLGREKDNYKGEEEHTVFMFSDQASFEKLSKEEQEHIMNMLLKQGDFLIEQMKNKKR
ncbi:helix-turn-helix domain-containing protein [Staphylococcus chromogenes]|uniref:helix-turn-helix domain-containing protein n=1 Tax=Staphylococcus chromogenes TaxID=46126 RepID=UPI003B00724B